MKTYVLMLSKEFPAMHSRKGEPTDFYRKILAARYQQIQRPQKFHTIRANYDIWRNRFNEIDAGIACLSIRQWNGKPYRSKQTELMRLTCEDGIGLQKLWFMADVYGVNRLDNPVIDYSERYYPGAIARNDGLEYNDWKEWFKDYDLSKPMAIIHFTKFRY